ALAVRVDARGVGVGRVALPLVGDPFFQARSSYARRHDGTGLGLSIVKGLVALHGGELTITSRIGEGTRVAIRLPIDCESVRQRADIAPIDRIVARSPTGAAAVPSDTKVKISA